MVFTPKQLLNRLQSLADHDRYLVAFSGGLDSTVLLHAMGALESALHAEISVVHIHHGLQARADEWVAHCKQTCRALGLSCRIIEVDAKPKQGESPEAAARHARYQALRALVTRNVCLLTAHHQDDQAETVLLQLFRGAGLEGLSAMPLIAPFAKGWHARPLLDVPREQLVQYANQYQLEWIDDPSNLDVGFDRNYIRHELYPVLTSRWPSVSSTLARTAQIHAEAVELTKRLAILDMKAASGRRIGTLSAKALIELSLARFNNLIRYWLRDCGLPTPTQRQLAQIRTDLIKARWDSRLHIRWPGAEVRRYRDDLYAMTPLSIHNPRRVYPWKLNESLTIPRLQLVLSYDKLESMGLNLVRDQAKVTVRFRTGGERCKPRRRAHHHCLKKLFQEAGVPPWERDRIPLIYVGDTLIAVIGYWVCV